LPLTTACPLPPEAPKEAVSPGEAPQAPNVLDFSQDRAFKVIFCPQGLDFSVKHIMMEPTNFLNTSFLQRAKDFFKNRFINEKKVVLAAISACSSIWVVGIVNDQGKWVHQILWAVIYTYSGPLEQSSFMVIHPLQ
jgi:hypothetical protein